jgi:hypothetical protein
MQPHEKKNLLYRRQFLLASKEISFDPSWKKINLLDKYILYVHPDLVYNEVTRSSKKLILLGEVYDPNDIPAGNMKIMDKLIENLSIGELAEATYSLAGRYAFIFIQNSGIFLFNDPSASRKIFYTTKMKDNWCGSQPHVIANFCNIKESVDTDVLDYYKSKAFLRQSEVNITDNTKYETIKQLLPNRYLNLKTGEAVRFYPYKPLMKLSLNEGVTEASTVITNIVGSFHHRHKLMMPVTSGNDSRVLLAASRKISDDIYYYINKNTDRPEDLIDITVADSLLNKMGLKLNIHHYPNEADEDFKEIYFQNSTFPLEENINLIYNVYYLKFQDRVNLPGNFSDISRNFLKTHKKVTPELLALKWKESNLKYIVDKYKIWMDEITPSLKSYNYDIMDLFNWEERNGNWYTTYQEDKDIAQEDLIAFNSRLYMDICLGVNPRHRDLDTNDFYRAMVKHMWPAAYQEKMYPKSWKRYYLKKLHLYDLTRRIVKNN